MRLDDQQESSNVEDRRGSSGMPIGGKSIGVGTIALALVAMYFGVDPSVVLNMGQGMSQNAPVEAQPIPQDDPAAKFVAKVLAAPMSRCGPCCVLRWRGLTRNCRPMRWSRHCKNWRATAAPWVWLRPIGNCGRCCAKACPCW